jgi:glycosyltransferase involved in cell wall biosynthesis
VRVLFDTYPWALATPGGGERQLLKYAEHLPRHGVSAVLHDLWHPAFDTVDAVHFFSCMAGSVPVCNYVRERGLPLVITSSLWIDEATVHLYPVGEIRAQLALADVIVPNSVAEATALGRIFELPRDRFMPVMNGVDERFTLPPDGTAFRRAFGIDEPFALHVGNIESRKNHLNLVRAMRDLDLLLVLVGGVRDKAYATKVFAEGGPHIQHLGPIDHESSLLPSAYAACSVFVMPSTLETPGLATLEAAAVGAPVVVTAEGSTREYFGDLVHYVDHDDPDDIRRAIDAALARGSNPQLKRHIAQSFTWPAVTAALPKVYDAAIKRRKTSAR